MVVVEEEEEEEEEDISEGVMPMFILCPSDVGVETFDPLLSPAVPEIRPWCNTNTDNHQRRPNKTHTHTPQENKQSRGKLKLTRSSLFCLSVGLFAHRGSGSALGSLEEYAASQQAVSPLRETLREQAGFLVLKASGGGVFTSLLFLLPSLGRKSAASLLEGRH